MGDTSVGGLPRTPNLGRDASFSKLAKGWTSPQLLNLNAISAHLQRLKVPSPRSDGGMIGTPRGSTNAWHSVVDTHRKPHHKAGGPRGPASAYVTRRRLLAAGVLFALVMLFRGGRHEVSGETRAFVSAHGSQVRISCSYSSVVALVVQTSAIAHGLPALFSIFKDLQASYVLASLTVALEGASSPAR
jgi:hypothetical protein